MSFAQKESGGGGNDKLYICILPMYGKIYDFDIFLVKCLGKRIYKCEDSMHLIIVNLVGSVLLIFLALCFCFVYLRSVSCVQCCLRVWVSIHRFP